MAQFHILANNLRQSMVRICNSLDSKGPIPSGSRPMTSKRVHLLTVSSLESTVPTYFKLLKWQQTHPVLVLQ